jgi:hypothetical protein
MMKIPFYDDQILLNRNFRFETKFHSIIIL